MKTFKQYTESCWKGYEAIGVKKKNGKTVPNCVPVKEDGEGGAVSAGPTNVTGTATSTDPVSATAVNMKNKKKPIVLALARRTPPKL